MLTVLSVDPESQIFHYWGQWKIFFPMQNIKDIYSFIDMKAYLLLPQDKMNELPNWNLIYKKNNNFKSIRICILQKLKYDFF